MGLPDGEAEMIAGRRVTDDGGVRGREPARRPAQPDDEAAVRGTVGTVRGTDGEVDVRRADELGGEQGRPEVGASLGEAGYAGRRLGQALNRGQRKAGVAAAKEVDGAGLGVAADGRAGRADGDVRVAVRGDFPDRHARTEAVQVAS